MRLFGKNYKLGYRYTMESNGNTKTLTKEFLMGFILNQISYLLPNYTRKHEFFNEMLDIIGVEAYQKNFMYDMEEYRGDLPSRIRKYFFLKNVPLPTTEYNILTREIHNATRLGVRELEFELCDTIDWQPGEFCEPTTSCWWDSYYSTGKCAVMWEMKYGRGFAVKLFDVTGRAAGRCYALLAPNKRDVILFNIYIDTYTASHLDFLNLFSEHLGVPYRYSDLKLDGNGYFYVNNDQGYVFSEHLEQTEEYYSFRLYGYCKPYDDGIERLRLPKSVDVLRCEICGRYYYERQVYYVKPFKKDICDECVGDDPRFNVQFLDFTVRHVNGKRTYYDRRYYMHSKLKPGTIVRKKGKEWVR